ncbi:MAG: TetR/AcrR family transcriptional regulator [Gammaproteobacteria bacterium]|nr:TetR/AcrR family transcriptional regulator [Gammaproteobacteria bacterium]
MAKTSGYHHGDLHNALLAAAEALLEKQGVGGVSLREVAKTAGVSHTAPYRHFKDKNALLAALATTGYVRLAEAMEACVRDHPEDPLQQMSQASHAYVELAIGHPQVTNLMFGGVLQPADWSDELGKESNRAFEGLLTIVRNGQESGRYVDKETREIALLVWSTVHGFSMLCSAGHLHEVAEDPRQITALVDSMGGMLMQGILK